MDRRKIEHFTASLAVFLLFFMTIGSILFTADLIFGWDLFPVGIEKILGFILASSFIIIISSVLINIMINLGIIALNLDRFVNKKKDDA